MLQLDNKTPYQAERAVLLDLDGSEIWVVAVKATFEIRDGKLLLAGEQKPVCLADEYHGEPGKSGMKYENELVFKKPGTDIVINGHAYAPKGRPVTKLDAVARIGPICKELRVYGDRIWHKSFFGLSISDPRPFDKMPLVYERAFGGADLSDGDPKKHGTDQRNPIGVGFAMSRKYQKEKPLPNLEDRRNLISNWNSRPAPTGYGLICKHWEPRRGYIGTCDQKWAEERMPLYPLDFNTRFLLGAHPDMAGVPHLRGGEPVELTCLTPDVRLSFTLPRIVLGFRTILSGKPVEHRATLGNIIIEPDEPRVMMCWQTYLPCHRKKFELEKTVIFEKEFISWK